MTENFVIEYLIKVQTFFESMCGKKSAGWMDKILKKDTYGVKCINTKNNPLVRYQHTADVCYHLDCWLVQACLPGAIVRTISTFLVCCKYNRQHTWLDNVITNM